MQPQDDDRLSSALSFLALALLSDRSLKADLEGLTREIVANASRRR